MAVAFLIIVSRFSRSDTVSDFRGGATMHNLTTLAEIWGAITAAFVILVIYRRMLTKQESDWIPLNNNEAETHAIQKQNSIEARTRKLSIPIRALGTVSVVMFLVIAGLWVYRVLSTQPTLYQ
jgi:glycerol uptake facilitator-like aquaporin